MFSIPPEKIHLYSSLLEYKMSDISEEHWAAGWLIGLEYALWGMLVGERSRDYGMGTVTQENLDILRELSEDLGGWMTFDGFVPMKEWLELYERNKKDAELREL